MKTALATLAAAGLALSATTAQAETVHVTYDDLDLGSIAAFHYQLSGLPVAVDASHGTGIRDLVFPLSLAGVIRKRPRSGKRSRVNGVLDGALLDQKKAHIDDQHHEEYENRT